MKRVVFTVAAVLTAAVMLSACVSENAAETLNSPAQTNVQNNDSRNEDCCKEEVSRKDCCKDQEEHSGRSAIPDCCGEGAA